MQKNIVRHLTYRYESQCTISEYNIGLLLQTILISASYLLTLYLINCQYNE